MRKRALRAYVISELVEVESNVSYIPNFGFSERLVWKSSEDDRSNIKIGYFVDKIVDRDIDSTSNKFNFYYETDEGDVYYEQHFGFGLKAKLLLKYNAQNPEIIVNPFYHKFIRKRIDDINPPGGHLADILRLKLIEEGFIPLHSSAFSYGDDGTIIFAPSNTGKTICVLHAVNHGCKFLSEDISVTDGRRVWGCPSTLTFIDSANLKGFSRILQELYKNIPITRPYLREKISINIDNIFETFRKEKIVSKTMIKRIIVLARGKEKNIQQLDENEASNIILNLNRAEFPYWNPLLFALQFFGKIDIKECMKKEEDIVEKMVSNADEILLLRGNPQFFMQTIDKIINR